MDYKHDALHYTRHTVNMYDYRGNPFTLELFTVELDDDVIEGTFRVKDQPALPEPKNEA